MSRSPQRRRQRSTRLVVACALLIAATLTVAAAAAGGSRAQLAGAAVLALACGVLATRITHSELLAARRDHARDRAGQARAYADLASLQAAESARHEATWARRLRLEQSERAAESRRADLAEQAALEAEALRDEAEGRLDEAEGRVEEAEQRTAAATLRVVELELELDVARAEDSRSRSSARLSRPA